MTSKELQKAERDYSYLLATGHPRESMQSLRNHLDRWHSREKIEASILAKIRRLPQTSMPPPSWLRDDAHNVFHVAIEPNNKAKPTQAITQLAGCIAYKGKRVLELYRGLNGYPEGTWVIWALIGD